MSTTHNTLWSEEQKTLVRLIDKNLPRSAYSIRVINGQLWCCCGYSGIVVLDTELRQLKTILPWGLTEGAWDVTEATDDDVIIAGLDSIYSLRPDGQVPTFILLFELVVIWFRGLKTDDSSCTFIAQNDAFILLLSS